MQSFQGKMKMAANPSESVGAGIEVLANSLTLIVSDSEVGVWPLNRIEVDVEDDGFHVQVDGEEFVFVTRDAEEFARAVGVLDRPLNGKDRTVTAPRPPVRKKPAKPTKAKKAAKPAGTRKARRQINLPRVDFASRQVQLAIAGLILVAVLGIFAAPLLAFLMMGAGSIGLLVGTGSLIDPIMATRLPAELPPSRMILVSVLFVVTGMTVLTFI